MHLLSELKKDTYKVRSMGADELLELIIPAKDQHNRLPTKQSATLLNWFIDVYNFKRGKLVLQRVADAAVRKPRFEKQFGEHLRT